MGHRPGANGPVAEDLASRPHPIRLEVSVRIHHANFWQDTVNYAMQIKLFNKVDWQVYTVWVGLMLGLLAMTLGFIWFGHAHGAVYPAYVWNIPMGVFIFSIAISFDTIGHRTTYKAELARGEALLHGITIFAGVTSNILLCLAYTWRDFLMMPTLVMVGLSTMYSIIDEALHWNRYLRGVSDRVEMWAHFGIFLGHFIFIFSWTRWFLEGYPGVPHTVDALRAAGILFF
jgi:hypothetical protein